MSRHRVLFLPGVMPILNAMLPAVHEMVKRNIAIDFHVHDFGALHELSEFYDEVSEYLRDMGFNVSRTVPENMKYDIVYSAYPGNHQEIAQMNQVKYYVRYSYGVGGANIPFHCYAQNTSNYYDYTLCLSEPDAKIFSGHMKTTNVGNIKLADYKRTRITPDGKKTLLYLPTYNMSNRDVVYKTSSITADTLDKLIELKSRYKITTKMHTFSPCFGNQHDIFNEFDHIHDINTPVDELLNQADIVLSDLSSIAFDAIAGDVPLALIGLGDLVLYGDKLCLHQQLVKDDIVPGTNNADELEYVIEKALTPEYFAKQQKLKKEMFPHEGRECLNAFMRFQDDLFNDRVDPWYIASRRAIRENYIKEQRETHERYANEMETAIKTTADKIKREYENSTSWRVTKPLRTASKIIRGG
jgi:CDP-glycerol glycerophosphotransferase (TagB/SpsB family)